MTQSHDIYLKMDSGKFENCTVFYNKLNFSPRKVLTAIHPVTFLKALQIRPSAILQGETEVVVDSSNWVAEAGALFQIQGYQSLHCRL